MSPSLAVLVAVLLAFGLAAAVVARSDSAGRAAGRVLTHPAARHALLVAALLAAVAMVQRFAITDARQEGCAWTALLYDAGTPQSSDPCDRLQEAPTLSPAETEAANRAGGADVGVAARLGQQLVETRRRAQHHLAVMMYFYIRYYMAILAFTVAAAGAGVALVLISRKGWADTSPYLLTVFLTLAVVAAFFRGFPGVFRQEENITENKALFVAYRNLEAEALSYLATGRTIAGDSVPAPLFVHHLDREMARLNTVALGFDYTRAVDYGAALSAAGAEGP